MMNDLFTNAFQGLPVLVTGHTGFKGSWLTTWLIALGAKVIGYSLPEPPTTPSNFVASHLERYIVDIRGNVLDVDSLVKTIEAHRPAIIFHLAAQPIVLRSVQFPKETLDTNAGGTVNVLEAVRKTDSVKAVVCITTDKVYKNHEWIWGYRENDRLGGRDPYSASKAMAELAVTAYRQTYFPPERYEEHGVAIATARAGNVIGGGDFADFRLVPDCMRALMNGEPIGIRNPLSVRPWQHVLESLSGYLWLAAKLLHEGSDFAESWNFGPLEQVGVPAENLAKKLIDLWESGSWVHTEPGYAEVETGQLRLNWDKAATRLGWRPIYTWEDALAQITAWFKSFQECPDMYEIGCQHIQDYVERARQFDLAWTR